MCAKLFYAMKDYAQAKNICEKGLAQESTQDPDWHVLSHIKHAFIFCFIDAQQN